MKHYLSRLSSLPLWLTINLIWQATGAWTLLWLGILMVMGVLPTATLYLTRALVNQVSASVGVGMDQETVRSLLVPVGLMTGVLLFSTVLGSLNTWVRTVQAELLRDHVSERVHQHSLSLDVGRYDSPDFYDLLNRARSGAGDRCLSLLENTGNLIRNSITLTSVTLILFTYGLWIPLILVLSTIPTLYIVLRLNRHQHQWWQRTTIDRRWLDYFELMITHRSCATEVRLFNLGDHFRSAYQHLRQRLRHEHLALIKLQTLNRLAAGCLALLVTAGAVAWISRQVLLGLITLGDLALFYQAFNQSQGLMKSSLGHLSKIYQDGLFIQNLFDFLALEPTLTDPRVPHPMPPSLTQGIRLEQVTFRYPGTSQPILEDFNLNIPAGKITAIVGDNGAGKSTLVKLLGRFYDPDAGQITWDGIDLRDLAQQDLRQAMTVLFQSPIPYVATPSENIRLGTIALGRTATQNQDIEIAAQAAGIHAKILRLAHGYDTLLGKAFPGGTDLSGGEWQRLALARAFVRQASLIVLDEPTSAMDPWAETDWLKRFRALAQGRTAVVITHRFTLAMKADIIHVMRSGTVVESGNHAELLAQDGFYAQSWHAQLQTPSNPSSPNPSLSPTWTVEDAIA